MFRNIVLGMAMQALVTAALTAADLIEPTAGQQAISGMLFMFVVLLIWGIGRRQGRNNYQR